MYGSETVDLFGNSINVTGDGTIIVRGSPGNYNRDDMPGYARVCKLARGDDDAGIATWEQFGQNITGKANGDEFGWSLSISAVGKTIAIGAKCNDGMNG
jgi:hypothetical protein